jgi:glycosyltransferase involved in cell wall biosynthesis
MRVVILLAKKRPPDLETQIANGEAPRAEYLELARRLEALILDFDSVETSRIFLVRALGRFLGLKWGLALLGAIRRKEFDCIYATGEDVGIPLAMFFRALFARGKLTVVIHNAATPKRRSILRFLGSSPFRYAIVLCEEQARVLREEVGFPASKVKVLRQWIDHRYYRPSSGGRGDYALSVGQESRDYPTLQAVAKQLPTCRFRVVASGWSPDAGYSDARGIAEGSNISVERNVSFARLRELYDNCRLAIVPLQKVQYAAGVTGIVEAMSMARGVIVSASPGIMDYTLEGKSGRVVSVGDADAMCAAVRGLWDDASVLTEMGTHNRSWIEREINTDVYVEEVAKLLLSDPRV